MHAHYFVACHSTALRYDEHADCFCSALVTVHTHTHTHKFKHKHKHTKKIAEGFRSELDKFAFQRQTPPSLTTPSTTLDRRSGTLSFLNIIDDFAQGLTGVEGVDELSRAQEKITALDRKLSELSDRR
jgi:hypothetical protein